MASVLRRRRPGRRRGLSLLEIMISMVLLVVVITSFAVVYPSGFRLHRKARMSSDAAQAARTILNELKSLPLTDDSGGLSLAYLATEGYKKTDPLVNGFPHVTLPDGYQLADEKGIEVILYDLASGTDPSVYASIKVTLLFTDRSNTKDEPQRMTLVAGKGWSR